MQYKPLHCWDCGVRVFDGGPGQYTAAPHMRQVKIIWSSGAYSESPFCSTCASRPWPRERQEEFEKAVKQVMPSFSSLHVMSVEGQSTLTEPIAGIFGVQVVPSFSSIAGIFGVN